jgi:glyoxylase-like metal-dependent hydrolase (beta-lactamase superfamily II)
MIIRRTGKIADGFYQLGHSDAPVYLLDAERPALFDAGYAFMGRLYEKEIRDVLGLLPPAFLFLTHGHFDHIGAAGFLKRVWPGLQVAASAGVADVLGRPRTVETMRRYNDETGRVYLKQGLGLDPAWFTEDPFEPVAVDLPLTDGTRVGLGAGLNLEVLETPGHTRDHLCFYVPERKILLAGEAAGIETERGGFLTDFLVDYDAFCRGMVRLSGLEIAILCEGHTGVFTGPDAAARLTAGQEACGRFAALLEFIVREEGNDPDRAAARVAAERLDPGPFPHQPEEAYLQNVRAKVRAILKWRADIPPAPKA